MRTMRSSARISAIVALLSSFSALAWGQNVGTLAGYVYDQAGTPLKGITVTISSPTQIGGTKTDVTNDEGGFRFSGLFPGRFKVTASAPKLRTAVVPEVRVAAASTSDVDIVMEVDTGGVEEIKIVEKGPPINMRSTTVGESFDADFLDSLPLESRDYQGVMGLAAGVSDLDGDGNPQVRGGTYFQNQYTVDGFNTTDPVTHTFGQNFSFTAMANVEVSTGGGDAEAAGVSGGITNIVTKSGSNRFELDTGLEYTDDRLRLFEDSRDRPFQSARLNVNVGGPIIRDKIWYFVSARLSRAKSSVLYDPNFPEHPALDQYGLDSIAKITWQMTPRNKLDLLAYVSPMVTDNYVQSLLVEPDAELRAFQRSELLGLTWQSQLTDDLFLITRLGYRQIGLEFRPQSCDWQPELCRTLPSRVDALSGIRRDSPGTDSLTHRRVIEFSGHTEWNGETRSLGAHLLRLTWMVEFMEAESRTTVPGDQILLTRGPLPFQRSEYCSNDPKLDNGVCRRNYLRSLVTGNSTLLSFTDSWKPTRHLTIKPGVAFHVGNSENDKGVKITNANAVTPHLTTTWDPTRDGKSKLQVGLRSVADTGFLALASFTSRDLYSRRCTWDEETESYSLNCRSQGGNDSRTVGLPCGPDGLNPDGSDCRTDLETPRVWELIGVAEREVATGIVAGTQLVYRRFTRQWEDAETNGNWNDGGTGLRREAPYKSGRSEFVFDLQTPEASKRTYRGVTAFMRKDQGRLKARLSYTWSKFEGATDGDFDGTFLDNPGQT
jgi:hypothetical protein